MNVTMFYDKEKNKYSLMLHNKILDVSVCVDITAEQAEEFKRVLTDIDEDAMLIYYKPKYI